MPTTFGQMKMSVEHQVREAECSEVSIHRTGRRTHSSGIHVKIKNSYYNSFHRAWGRTPDLLSYTNPSLLTGNSTIIRTSYKKKHSPSLGIQNQDQKVSSPWKNVSTCAHVLCNVNTTGIIFLWDFIKSIVSVRLEQLVVRWWGDEVMCQRCTAHFLHSGSRDKVVTSIQSLDAESRVTRSPLVPRESVSTRWLFQGLLLMGPRLALPWLLLHFALFQPLYVVT